MAAHSPFTPPTAFLPVPTPISAPAGPHWWDQLAITSLMEAGGTYFATVIDHTDNKHYVLQSGRADQDTQLLLTGVQWNERTGQSTIIVRKGTEVAPPLRFDAATVPSSPAEPPQLLFKHGESLAARLPVQPNHAPVSSPNLPSIPQIKKKPPADY